MVCNNCGKQIPDNSKNCNNCGTVFPQHTKNYFCAICGSELSANNQCPNCSASGNSGYYIPPQQKIQNNILKIVLIAVIFLAVAGGGVLLGLTLSKSEPETASVMSESDNSVSVQDNESEPKESDPSAPPSSNVPVSPQALTEPSDGNQPADLPLVSDVTYKIDQSNELTTGQYIDPLAYDYNYGQTELIEHPSYSDFNYPGIYTCKLPEHFNKVYIQMDGADYDHYRFEAPDGTAIISLNCSANVMELSAEEMKNSEIVYSSGEVTYSPNGDTWYALSIDYGNIISYKKVFLTETEVMSFEMMFPSEYLDIYDDYVEYIEDNYKPIL